MIAVQLNLRALADLQRLEQFRTDDPRRAETALEIILDALQMLRRHPYIGRPVRGSMRELVISFGRTGHVALYRIGVAPAHVEVLRIRHQLEAGYGS